MDMKNRISNATPPVSSTNVPDTSQRPGTLDLEFGEYQDGMVIFSEAGPGFVGPSLLQKEGRHLFIGVHDASSNSMMLADFVAEGFYYNHFTSSFPGPSRTLINASLDNEQNLVILGNFRADEQAFCTRLTTTGERDLAFGDQGEVRLPYRAPWTGRGHRITLQTDGHILMLLKKTAKDEPERDVIVRLDRSGHLDHGFGTCGVVTAQEPDIAFEALALQADGKLVVAGSRGRRAVLMRYDSTGLPDASFGNAGYLEFESISEGNATLFAVAVQQDQKIVAAGSANLPRNVALLVRSTEEGRLDPEFNTGSPLAFPGIGICLATVIQEDGRIVSVGHIDNGSQTWLMRHLGNGEVDREFGDKGISRVNRIPGDTSYFSHLELQPDGKILISGRYASHSAVIRCHGS
ncbi:delta-60 repeat domain-containing protein [Pseudomonas asplenii]|uniref:Delta-60 repeat domain-containing protein n=1 Tax=Pseudomonas asplenii TaxID=53407 RepID=A0A1H1V1Q3_9PSED|nr:hemolysin [Pseudomonas asplenii]SDS78451.1 delta-60 repeat domain-containing protein [Pseudomonas asplenii]